MTSTLEQREQVWIEQFAWFDNWQDKYQFIIDQGRSLAGIPEATRNDSMLVKGCQSQVWLQTEVKGNNLYVVADSDALIVKGLIAIIVNIYNDAKISEIAQYDHGFAKRLGLDAHLSPARANGLYAIISKIKAAI